MPDRAVASRRILVVDDDRAILNLLRLLLESEGYTVTTAASLDQALRLLRQDRPSW